MTLLKKYWAYVVAVLVVLALAGGGYWYYAKTHVPAFPISAADTISSWQFTGAYTNNDTLMAQAQTDMRKLSALLGKGQYPDYDIYVGIANDYTLMGDGKQAYNFYNRAEKADAKRGLAYANLGHLFDLLGAKHTAAAAYAAAVKAEPGQLEFHLERLSFLVKNMPDDTAEIQAAFTDASNQFGDTAQVLQTEAQWLDGQKRYADAITAWEKAKQLSPGRDTSAIDAQIARDKAKAQQQ